MVRITSAVLLSIAFCLCLAGCSRAKLMKKMTPAEDESFARKAVDSLRQRQFEQIERELDPSIPETKRLDTLATMAGMFPQESPKSVKVVDLRFFFNQGFSTHSLTLEYEFPEKWLLVNVSIRRANDGVPKISGFNVTPVAESLETLNRFGLAGKSVMQYAVLGLAVTEPIFCLYVLVLAVRSKSGNRKWLWALFILFGFGKLAVNWTTAEWTFTPLAFQMFCSSATAVPPYGPWVVAVSLPLGAILFLVRVRQQAETMESQLSAAGELPPTI